MPFYSLVALALSLNVPLGYLRGRARRFSAAWFIWLHLSIPLIATARILSGFGWTVAPVLMAAAIAGQLVGGRIRMGAG